MCGRASQTKKKVNKEHRFAPQINEANLEPVYNVVPSQNLPVITSKAPDILQSFTWGIPTTIEGEQFYLSNSNLRKLATWGYYLDLFKKGQTCLVLIDGFYEWETVAKGGKIPYRIQLKNQDVFAVAGLWDKVEDPKTGEPRNFFSMVTLDPNELISSIHSRMPAILPAGLEKNWLQFHSQVQEYTAQIKPFPAYEMEAYTISKKIDIPGYNRPDILEPYTWPKQLSLF
ncbi:MAG: SOS response-associated peptidase [Bacteroidota bacterium]|nr:SOS response-associated peptidase [Bacteroidota bacterium]